MASNVVVEMIPELGIQKGVLHAEGRHDFANPLERDFQHSGHH